VDIDGSPRVALVTGAAAGIGRAIAIACGAQGWRVAVASRRLDALEETAKLVDDAGGHASAHFLDLTDDASIDAAFAGVMEQHGRVDLLVNNAGLAFPGPAHEMGDGEHRRIVETNFLGAVLLTKRVVHALVEARDTGDVVFVSSDAVVHDRPRLATYAATKAAIESFARTLALELEGTGIRSTIVRVGPTESGFADGWDPSIFDELIPYWQRFGAQRHWGICQPEDIAAAVIAAVTAPARAHVSEISVGPSAPPAP
jgi:NADP-dependent 3-hydroxy acid dehydrogenase YdfG